MKLRSLKSILNFNDFDFMAFEANGGTRRQQAFNGFQHENHKRCEGEFPTDSEVHISSRVTHLPNKLKRADCSNLLSAELHTFNHNK